MRGGRSTRNAAGTSAAAASASSAITCPAGPATASRCPGSGLAAGDGVPVRPSGNSTVLRSSAPGTVTSQGSRTAANTAAAAAANRATVRRASGHPAWLASSAAATARAGQAVAFIAAARPSTAPAATVPRQDRVPASASPSVTRPSTGTSLPLTTSGNAMTGVAASTAVALAEARPGRPATRNATSARGRERQPGPQPRVGEQARAETACGSPNTVMAGRYGL